MPRTRMVALSKSSPKTAMEEQGRETVGAEDGDVVLVFDGLKSWGQSDDTVGLRLDEAREIGDCFDGEVPRPLW